MPYVQEGYLQDHYSPNLPRKKSQTYQKEPPPRTSDDRRHPDSNDIRSSPKRKPITDHNVQGKAVDGNNALSSRTSETNRNAESLIGVRRVGSVNAVAVGRAKSAKQSNSGEHLTRVIPDCFTAVSEKKKLKFSPPPEGATTARHQAVNADKSFDNLSNRSSASGRLARRLLTAMFRGGLKLKERLLVGVSVATVLFTLLLVVDLQMDTGMTRSHIIPSHARVKYGDGQQFNSFRNRILQRTNW